MSQSVSGSIFHLDCHVTLDWGGNFEEVMEIRDLECLLVLVGSSFFPCTVRWIFELVAVTERFFQLIIVQDEPPADVPRTNPSPNRRLGDGDEELMLQVVKFSFNSSNLAMRLLDSRQRVKAILR